ncbi:MAG: YcxB family protein [Oscillospiraceae bacterium]|nr:YcxB family protein [Oscillospiraceae bacterium]
MEFTFDTIYDKKALTTMARALRKTVRKKHSRRSHFLGSIIAVMGIVLPLIPRGGEIVIGVRAVISWLMAAVILFTLLKEDSINGFFASGRMLPGTDRALVIFNEEGYISETDIGKTEWHYDKIHTVAETDRYFVLIFNDTHAQIYDKRSLEGGTVRNFREFISEKTGKPVEQI